MGRGRGTGTWDSGTWGRGARGRGDVGTWGCGDAGTRGCGKQTIPVFCAEFVKYNFWWSRERYYMLESL